MILKAFLSVFSKNIYPQTIEAIEGSFLGMNHQKLSLIKLSLILTAILPARLPKASEHLILCLDIIALFTLFIPFLFHRYSKYLLA